MARYSDGRTALVHACGVSAREDGLHVSLREGVRIWEWTQLTRADDGGETIILKFIRDTGERITLSAEEADAARAFAPSLLSQRGLRREGAALVLSLMAAAGALAAVFLVGVPLAAGPIAHSLPQRYQDHLADIGWNQVYALSSECEFDTSSDGWVALDNLFDALKAHAHGVDSSTVHVVDATFPNAFTLPDGSIVVTNRLIHLAESPDEVAGVLAHELGHVEAEHVMAGVVRQMGVGMFVDVVFGGAGAGQAVAAINVLALRYSRADEAEADAIAIRLMDEANFNPGAIASFFEHVRGEEAREGASIPEMLSSHPDSARRAQEAARHARPGRPPALGPEDWAALHAVCPSTPAASEGLRLPRSPFPPQAPQTQAPQSAKPAPSPGEAPKPPGAPIWQPQTAGPGDIPSALPSAAPPGYTPPSRTPS